MNCVIRTNQWADKQMKCECCLLSLHTNHLISCIIYNVKIKLKTCFNGVIEICVLLNRQTCRYVGGWTARPNMILSQSQHKTCSVQSAVWYNDAILQPGHLQQVIDLTSPVLVVLASSWAVGAAHGVKPTWLIKHFATAEFTWLPCWV